MLPYLTMNPFGFPILTTTIFLPLVGALFILFIRNDKSIRNTAFIASLATLAVSVLVFANFDYTTPVFQFGERIPWVPAYNINYMLGIDGISVMLVMLTTVIAVSYTHLTLPTTPYV